jgi:membrane protease YdiL (CAAX protease family)
MNGAFGRGDWIVNGLLFTAYHVDMPWNMPATLVDMFVLAYPAKRYRSAWIGMAVHGSQSVFFAWARSDRRRSPRTASVLRPRERHRLLTRQITAFPDRPR